MKPFFSILISPLNTFEYLSTRDDSENSKMINILSAIITIGLGIPRLKDFTVIFEIHKLTGLIFGVVLFGLNGILVIKILGALVCLIPL